MQTTVDFRRKILNFDRPIYADYRASSIPKYYSRFFPSFWTYYVGWKPGHVCKTGDTYPVKFPITDVIDQSSCAIVDASLLRPTKTPNLLLWLLVLLTLAILFLR